MTERAQKRRTSSISAEADRKPVIHSRSLWAITFLIAITLLAYYPVLQFGFVNFDDPLYVTDNAQVLGGLTWQNTLWALTASRAANWHPLTWLSHMLDVELFGLNGWGHHLTSLLVHIANTLLLFWLLFKMTASIERSAFVAALFAVHPLHVESVAWVAERKDILSTLFWMLTVCAYILYVERPSRTRYFSVAALFALGLTAKPMLVTLPFVLLLLDYWPLGRMKTRFNVLRLVREKIPFLVIAIASSLITIIVQRKGGAVLETVPLIDRIGNASIAYFTYARKMFWPTDLAVMYPLQTVPVWWIASALGLLVLTILSIWLGNYRPHVPVGWFWYLGTLLPVIGLVQAGGQALADRYTYVPLIGLFLIVAFAIPETRAGRNLLLAGGGMALLACIWATHAQLGYWSSSQALWEHALSVTTENSVAHFNLAVTLDGEGKPDDAKQHYAEALRIQTHSGSAQARYNPTVALANNGQTGEAVDNYAETLRLVRDKQKYLKPDEEAKVRYNFGIRLANEGKLEEAGEQFTEAIQLNPNFPEAHNSLGTHYLLQHEFDKAIVHFSEAIRLKPDYAMAHNNLGGAFGNQGRLEKAVEEYKEALRFDPAYEEAHTNLGIVLAKQGKTTEAIAQFSETLRINPQNQTARTWLDSLTSKTAPNR